MPASAISLDEWTPGNACAARACFAVPVPSRPAPSEGATTTIAHSAARAESVSLNRSSVFALVATVVAGIGFAGALSYPTVCAEPANPVVTSPSECEQSRDDEALAGRWVGARTPLAARILELREKMRNSGARFLSEDEIRDEMVRRRTRNG